MSEAALWLAGLASLPVVVIGASLLRLELERLRRIAVVSAAAMLLMALVVAAAPRLHAVSVRTSALTWVPGGEAIIRVDTLSAVLLPFAAALWLLTVAVTPRAALDRGGLRRTALATLVTLASFLTESAVALLLLSMASVWTFLMALGDPAQRQQRRVVAVYLGFSTLLFATGVAVLISPGVQNTAVETAAMWLIVAAALVRKGIVPFHAWVPEVFDRGRLGPAILFNAPQVGAYMTVVLIVPRASPEMLRVIALLALGTAVYGAALALVQTSARRACGYLFMSQSALVMAGLDCTSVSALAGGLLVWLSAGLAFAGLARCVLVLEARRGRLDLTTYHGGYERMPLLAISFLAMGLACTGFPGTLGFVGQELLVDGAVDAFPVMGFAVVAASALTGLGILRMYFSLFCGRPQAPAHAGLALGLTRREAWTFVALVIVLVAFGVAPRPLTDSRFAASEEILRLRQQAQPASSEVTVIGEQIQIRTRFQPPNRSSIRPRRMLSATSTMPTSASAHREIPVGPESTHGETAIQSPIGMLSSRTGRVTSPNPVGYRDIAMVVSDIARATSVGRRYPILEPLVTGVRRLGRCPAVPGHHSPAVRRRRAFRVCAACSAAIRRRPGPLVRTALRAAARRVDADRRRAALLA
jgi:NADH-quinone oxidoreductase subunit M